MTTLICFPRPGVQRAVETCSSPSGGRPVACSHSSMDPCDVSDQGADRIGGEQSVQEIDIAVPAFVRAMADGFREPGLPDAAMVVACALRWTTRRGRKLSSLPKLIRLQLDMLCDAADPTALMVRDWIEGRSPLELGDGADANNAGTATADAHETGRA